MMSQLQHTQPTSAMWLTGAAPNTLAIGLAKQQGVQLPGGAWCVSGGGDRWLNELRVHFRQHFACLPAQETGWCGSRVHACPRC
jgi:hypothetical protein